MIEGVTEASMLRKVMLAILALLIAAPAIAAGGVVSAADPRAAAAGREILRAGGSSTRCGDRDDAGAQLVEPQSSGIGGGGFLVHAGSDGASTIDGRETAPASGRPDRFLTPDGKKMAFMDAVPGGTDRYPGRYPAGRMARQRWGRLPSKQLFASAISSPAGGFADQPRA